MELNICEDCASLVFNKERETCALCSLYENHFSDVDYMDHIHQKIWDEIYLEKTAD